MIGWLTRHYPKPVNCDGCGLDLVLNKRCMIAHSALITLEGDPRLCDKCMAAALFPGRRFEWKREWREAIAERDGEKE